MVAKPLEGVPVVEERRKYQRLKFHGRIEIEWGSAILIGTVRDIGPKGLFVELTPPLWVGATFLARIFMNPVLRLECTVRRVEPGKGIAIGFEVPEESGRAQLEALLATLPSV